MLIFTLNKNNFKNLDFTAFWPIVKLMLRHRHKLFDDEYLNSDTPLLQRVYEIVEDYIPYFWLFLDKKTAKTLGFCYLYDIVTAKNTIYTACATICFDKSAYGPRAQNAAKTLLNTLFQDYKIYKIKAECYSHNIHIPNFLVKLGFCREAVLKNETIVENRPENIEIWSIFNPAPGFVPGNFEKY